MLPLHRLPIIIPLPIQPQYFLPQLSTLQIHLNLLPIEHPHHPHQPLQPLTLITHRHRLYRVILTLILNHLQNDLDQQAGINPQPVDGVGFECFDDFIDFVDILEVEVLIELEEDGDVELWSLEYLVFAEYGISGGVMVNDVGVVSDD